MIDFNRFKGVQADILKANKKNQLVSAGAGSGKTTVMIEKIADLILEQNVDVDNLLVVTFTVLAAQEMKERLEKKLKAELINADESEKERILTIIEKINTASIDTIDGFASKTIKKYFYDLQISPNIEIITDTTKDYYLSCAMKRTFEEFSKGDDLNIMLDLYGGNSRNFETLQKLILGVYRDIINIEDYDKFLADCIDEYNDSVKSENVVNSYICELASNAAKTIIENYSALDVDEQKKLSNLSAQLTLFNAKMSFKTNLKLLNSIDVVKYTKKDFKDNIALQEINNDVVKLYALKDDLKENEIDENYEEKNAVAVKYFNIFIDMVKRFLENYNNIKKNNNLIDFNDLNRLMLKLLENENIKLELQQKYKYIFIDEYQDVNPMQDSLMTKITGEDTTVFMVGDVKQSIYGFRGSSPEWFLNKYNKMKSSKTDEDVFDMNVNFRSSPIILNFINEIFANLMTEKVADINYARDCMIEPKKLEIKDEKVGIKLVCDERKSVEEKGVYSVKNHTEEVGVKTKDKEALIVLDIISNLHGKEFYDAKQEKVRKLRYSDFAILTHTDKDDSSKVLINLLREHAIPLNINNKLEIKASESLKLILSILKCINHTADDVDYLAAFMALTELTMDDITTIRNKEFSFYENLIQNSENEQVKHGFKILDEIKKASHVKTNKELISYILNDQKLKYFILRKSNGENELGLLEEFLQKLSYIEDTLGIAEFIEVIESNVSKSGDYDIIDEEESVTLQTIHKSKGLEYPVVILFNSGKTFSYLGEHDLINFNTEIGIGVEYFDVVNRIKRDTLTKYAIKILNNKKGYKEELRLLYVALTRAKNKLFITGSFSKSVFEELKKNCYSNMFLSCLIDKVQDGRAEGKNYVLEMLDDVKESRTCEKQEIRQVEEFGLDFKYPHTEKFDISVKNSVTGINSKLSQDKGFASKQVFKKSSQYDIEDKAKVGTDYHKVLENLDLTRPYEKTINIETVDYKKIEIAHKKLSVLVEDAVSIEKEAEFMMYVPYNEIVAGDIADKVLVQGVVDLIIEKKNTVVLVDYKFSTLPANILKERYAEQLNLYKKAVEYAYHKPVEHMYIYSINTGELV